MGCPRCGNRTKLTTSTMISTVGTTLPYLKFYHCAFKDQFESLFRNAGFPASENTLPALSLLANTGGDLRGDFTDANGRQVKFDTTALLNQLDTSKPVNNSCSI